MGLAPENFNNKPVAGSIKSVEKAAKLLVFSMALLATACGGGGGGADMPVATLQPQPPVQLPAPSQPPAPQPPAPQSIPVPPPVPQPTPPLPEPQPVPPTPPQPQPLPPVSNPGSPEPVYRPDAVIDVLPGTWVVLGSSTAAGAGAPAGKGWVSLIAQRYAAIGANVVNLAKPGSVTYQGLSATRVSAFNRPASDPAANMDAALSHRPRVVILAYPTNDTAQGYAVEETVRNLLDMRAMALERGAQVIVLSTQPRNLDVEKRRKLLEINARLQSVVTKCFVNVHSPLADKEDLLARIYNSGDGVHPSAQGHVLISTLIGWLIDTNTCTRLQK